MKLFFKMSSLRNWIICCFFNFIVASIVGLLMRFSYLFPFKGINYMYLLHAHSHVAMLGWVYMMIYVLIVQFFIPKEKSAKPIYNHLFWITECTIIGMMVSFPIQGYALFSILFSTLHILLSYVFCWLVWRDFSKDKSAAEKLLIASILFMILSTFGVWCLGPTINMLGKQSFFYQIAIQFFLHFQFNGWFMFAVLALFFKQAKLNIDEKKFNVFYNLFVIGTVLTLALPVSWSLSNPIFYWINAVGVLIQLFSAVVFIQLIRPQFQAFFSPLSTLEKTVYRFAFFSLALKVIIQLVVLVPELAQVSHQIRNFVIGYIHLTMLGIITGFLFGFAFQNGFISSKNAIQKWGTILFLLGFVATEILLFLQGIWLFLNNGSFPNYYLNLFLSSIFLPTGLLMLTIGISFKNKQR